MKTTYILRSVKNEFRKILTENKYMTILKVK